MKKLIHILIFFLLGGSLSYAQVSKDIDKIVNDAMESFTMAGAAVVVVKDGEVIHMKGYGVKSVDSKKKVDEHTNFAIASNTKAFTTAALSILVEEGNLSWTDKVVTHVPEFKMYNAYVTENFNIQDLLTHRSGLGLGAGDLMFFPPGADFTINDVITSFQYFEPQSAFRTKYDYDNLLYLVAGEVIKRVSGMSWESFVKSRILEPLGMDNSYTNLNFIKDLSNVADPHLVEKGQIRVIEPDTFDPTIVNGAAGAIYSNVDDLANWLLVQLNHGKYGDDLSKQLFSERSQREMWKIHTTTNVNRNPRYNSHFAGYGLGWALTDVQGNMSASHTGGLPGMLSKTLLIPDLNLGVVVLTNTFVDGAAVFTSVTNSIMDQYLELEEFDWNSTMQGMLQRMQQGSDSVVTAVWETVAKADASSIDPKDYIGVYEDNWFGKIEVLEKDGQLWFKSYRSPKLNGPMAFYKANSFAIRWEYQDLVADAFAMFSLDENGKAVSIKMKGIAPDIDFSYDFQDLDLRRVE
jgi:CubicO group peptidase (beta-lactamase class C family)